VGVFDSTTNITLFNAVFIGTGRKPLEGEKKIGFKVFAKTNLAEGLPSFICIRSAATNANMFLKVFQFKELSIKVFNKR
jgi:hypothetical protein